MQTLATIEQRFSQRAKSQAIERATLLNQVRDFCQAIVEEVEPQPNPDEIIQVCDRLGVSFGWFQRAIENCRARLADCEATKKLPELNQKYSILQAEFQAMQTNVDAARNRLNLLEFDMLNPSRQTEFDTPWQLDKGPEDFARLRQVNIEYLEAVHAQWEIKRQWKLLEKDIRQMRDSINPNVADLNCGRGRPWDFRLPELDA